MQGGDVARETVVVVGGDDGFERNSTERLHSSLHKVAYYHIIV
jgi:hypothetical protein